MEIELWGPFTLNDSYSEGVQDLSDGYLAKELLKMMAWYPKETDPVWNFKALWFASK